MDKENHFISKPNPDRSTFDGPDGGGACTKSSRKLGQEKISGWFLLKSMKSGLTSGFGIYLTKLFAQLNFLRFWYVENIQSGRLQIWLFDKLMEVIASECSFVNSKTAFGIAVNDENERSSFP